MKKKLLFLIHTEYHLLLAIYYLYSNNYLFNNEYEYIFLLNAGPNSRRLNKQLDFSSLPIKVHFLDIGKNVNEPMSSELKQILGDLENQEISEFNFFQEQDYFAVIILSLLKDNNIKINLFQDGLKPYVSESLGFTPSLHIQDFKINKYIQQNGYKVTDWFSSFRCHKYGFLKNIDNLYLTFPESFPRKHQKNIKELDFKIDNQLLKIYQKIFNWNDNLLTQKENVIFFLNQPMRDDGSFDMNILRRLKEMYPDHPIIIKNHPNTPKEKIMQYNSLDDCTVIDSKIPAELFLATLNKSIIISVCSTAMFVDNPSCSFYYLYNIIEKNNIGRLKKYKVINPTSHVLLPERIEEIEFQ
jgi:hypothetical protein